MPKSLYQYNLFLLLLFYGLNCFSQNQPAGTDAIIKKIELYHKKTGTPTLFVHFDKTVYVSNEQVWFTGYLLNGGQHLKEHSIMSVSLVKNDTRAIITSQKFVMTDGISSGSMLLPDSIPPGHYTLMAYTNLLEKGKPMDVFQQAVTIKTVSAIPTIIPNSEIAKATPPTKYSVKFYPEGGNMINGLMGRIGFEIKSSDGKQVNIHGVLFKDNKPVDTIETAGYGMGVFFLKPETGCKYSFKLLGEKLPDTAYLMPNALSSGPTISIANAVATDTLKIRIANNKPGKLLLVIHNYKEVFYALPIETNELGRTVKIVLTDIPKGLTAATLLNEQEQPLAERMFFAHFDPEQNEKINITTDKPEYGKREKVSLHLKLNDPKLENSLVSVAVVQGNRVEELNKQDIGSYYYLKHDLEELPFKTNYFGSGENDNKYLENVLLIKGWRRYKWEDVMNTTAKDTVRQFTIPQFTGVVTKENGKPIGKPVPVTLFADSSANIIMADKKGYFVADPKFIIVNNFTTPYFLLQKNTFITVNNPFIETEKLIVQKLDFTEKQSLVAVQVPDALKLTGQGIPHQLKEVKIVDANDNNLNKSYAELQHMGPNDCGDFVCPAGFLNCPSHSPADPRNTTPIPGHYYHDFLYKGCILLTAKKQNTVSIDQIFKPSDYYGYSPDQENPFIDYQSTIYWNNYVKVDAKEKTFSFYTDNITGDFKIIVQGISERDVVYGEKQFSVKK